MPARYIVLLTPLECAVPASIRIRIISRPTTSLESALTRHIQLAENTATLSPAECAVTNFLPITPLECAVTKNTGGADYRQRSSSTKPPSFLPRSAPPRLCAPTDLPSSVHSSKFRIPQVLYLPLLRKQPGCGGILPISELLEFCECFGEARRRWRHKAVSGVRCGVWGAARRGGHHYKCKGKVQEKNAAGWKPAFPGAGAGC
jgi:hypothetical protein